MFFPRPSHPCFLSPPPLPCSASAARPGLLPVPCSQLKIVAGCSVRLKRVKRPRNESKVVKDAIQECQASKSARPGAEEPPCVTISAERVSMSDEPRRNLVPEPEEPAMCQPHFSASRPPPSPTDFCAAACAPWRASNALRLSRTLPRASLPRHSTSTSWPTCGAVAGWGERSVHVSDPQWAASSTHSVLARRIPQAAVNSVPCPALPWPPAPLARLQHVVDGADARGRHLADVQQRAQAHPLQLQHGAIVQQANHAAAVLLTRLRQGGGGGWSRVKGVGQMQARLRAWPVGAAQVCPFQRLTTSLIKAAPGPAIHTKPATASVALPLSVRTLTLSPASPRMRASAAW